MWLLILVISLSSCAVQAATQSNLAVLPANSISLSCDEGFILSGRIWNRSPKNEGCIIGENPYISCVPETNYTDIKIECVKK